MARVPKTIELEEAIICGSKEIKEVTMRAPKGKDLKAVSHISNTVERDLTLVSNLCGLNMTFDEWDEVDAAEIQLLTGVLRSFLLYTPKN